ncbi:hypothetical protein V492_04912, partial [Pseudogymnoascus sp. VKM F-4246]
MKNLMTPLLNSLRSPFIGSSTPGPTEGDSNSPFPKQKTAFENLKSLFPKQKPSFVTLKSPLLGHKPSLANVKAPILGHKISIPFFSRLKTPFLRAKSPKATETPLNNTKSPFPGFFLFKSLASPFIGKKDRDVKPKPAPAPVLIQVPIPVTGSDVWHIPPYHHDVDCEVGYYDKGDAYDAFMSSLPNLRGGYRYIATNRRPGYGDPHFLGFPVNVRFRVYQYMTVSILKKNKKIVLSPDRTIKGFWPENTFTEPGAVMDIIGSLSVTCFQLRHEVMTYYCSQFDFHMTFDYFCGPIVAPLIHKWLPLFGHKMQYLTVELDFTRVGGCYRNDKFALTDGQTEIRWLLKRLVLALRDRSGSIRSLHIMCRRYKGFHPPSQKHIREKDIAEKDAEGKDAEGDAEPPDRTSLDSNASDNTSATSFADSSLLSLPSVDTSHNSVSAPISSHATSEPPNEIITPPNDGLLKYCTLSTTAVLGIVPIYLGRSGKPLYHFRLSGFSKSYTKEILTAVSTVGNAPLLLITPAVRPWRRDYPEIDRDITTTDGNYLGTVVKFVNIQTPDDVVPKTPRTGKMAATRKFIRRAISMMPFVKSSSKKRPPETKILVPYYPDLPEAIEDSDIESVSDKTLNEQGKQEGVGLGIQVPKPHIKYPLLEEAAVEKDIKLKLERPETPEELIEELPIVKYRRINEVSIALGELFGTSEPKPKTPALPPDSMYSTFGILCTVPEEAPVIIPSITVMSVSVPDIQEQMQRINDMSANLDGLFGPRGQPAPVAASTPPAAESEINRPGSLGGDEEGSSQLGIALHTIATTSTLNSALYTDASESTLDMAFSDPTIPPQYGQPAPMHEQEVDSSTTLYLPYDGPETPTLARSHGAESSQARELLDHTEMHLDQSRLEVQTIYSSSVYSSHGTRSRSNTDGSDILDWPLPNDTIPQPTRSPPPPPPPPPPPVPEIQNELHQITTATSRATLRFADGNELQQIPSALSRRTIRFSDEDHLHEIHTSSSRRTLRFAEPDIEEQEWRARRSRSTSFAQKRKEEERKIKERMSSLGALYGTEPSPGPAYREDNRSRSRSGSVWSNVQSQQDEEDEPSRPALRNSHSFPANADANGSQKDKSGGLWGRTKSRQEEDDNSSHGVLRKVRSIAVFGSKVEKPQRGRSGSFWKKLKSKHDTEDNNNIPSQPELRKVASFSSNVANASGDDEDYGEEEEDEPEPVPPPPNKIKRIASNIFSRKKKDEPKEIEKQVVEVEAMSNSFNLLFNDSTTNVPTQNSMDIGRRSRSGGIWESRDMAEQQPDVTAQPYTAVQPDTAAQSDSEEEDNTPRPPLRSTRSFSFFKPLKPFKPLRLRRRPSALNTTITEQADEQSPELPNDLSDELSNDPSTNPSNEQSTESSADPTPDPTTRSRTFFSLSLRRRPSALNTTIAEQADEQSPKQSNDLSDELSNDPSSNPSNEQSTDPSLAPTPDPIPRSRTFFSLRLRKKKSKAKTKDAAELAAEIEAMSSNLSLIFNGSSATIARDANDSSANIMMHTSSSSSSIATHVDVSSLTITTHVNASSASVATNASTRTIVPQIYSRITSTSARTPATPPLHSTSPMTAAANTSTTSLLLPIANSPNTHSGLGMGTGYQSYNHQTFPRRRPAAAGGSIFGPRGGPRDGRGSLANTRWGAGEEMLDVVAVDARAEVERLT